MDMAIANEEMVTFRQHLHQYPEISWQEYQTTHLIKQKALSFGVEPHMIKERSGPGLWIDIPGLAEPTGKDFCVLIRADIDALRMH